MLISAFNGLATYDKNFTHFGGFDEEKAFNQDLFLHTFKLYFQGFRRKLNLDKGQNQRNH
ncbi:hypothetical protein GCM10011412_12030 [Maribacter cobaltidurans]|nr:hypothetical protein GCM10011412_12030 [Maribacter cobaltidurans]